MFVLFALATVLVGQKPRNISGTVLDVSGENVGGTTVLLLIEDGTESQRTETSKRGAFKFKKVSPGKYKIDIDAGDLGKLNTDVEVSDKNVKLGDLSLIKNQDPVEANTSADVSTTESSEPTAAPPTAESAEFTPDPGKDYILNELSFEIKKMTAELKYLNEELENLKALSKI